MPHRPSLEQKNNGYKFLFKEINYTTAAQADYGILPAIYISIELQ
ncbi:hypothetical protein C1A50_1673 [Paenibacillus polymyxa]|nr:hypothetical protein C1A50_1673 [Paenibacillus polymyxa]